MTTESTVRVTRTFSASPERVFDAWLDPTKIGAWMKAPATKFGLDDELVRIDLDARIGGSFAFVVRRKGQIIEHIGQYLEIDRPRRLVFTWGIGPDPATTRVTIELVPQGTGTPLTLTHERVPEQYAKPTETGWAAIADAIGANA